MIVEDTIEGICSLFRLLTAFLVQLARVVHPLAGSICPSLDIPQPPLEHLSLFCHFGVGDSDFRISMIDIDTKRDEPVSNGILLCRPALGVGLYQLSRICLCGCRHNGDQLRLHRWCRERCSLPAL